MAVLDSILCEGPVASRVSNGKLIIEQEINYRVIAGSPTEDRISILQTTPDLPIAQVDDNGGGLKCRSVRLTPVKEHRCHYIATALFSSEVSESTDPATPMIGDPVDWVPQAEVEFEPADQVMTKDAYGKVWQNTAKQAFENGIVIPHRIPCRVFYQFEKVAPFAPNWAGSAAYAKHSYVTNDSGKIYQCKTAGTSAASGGPTGTGSSITDGSVEWGYVSVEAGSVNLDQIEARCDIINSTPFRGRAAKTLHLEVRRAAIGTYYGYRRWRIEYAMKYREETWVIKQPNVGKHYVTPAGGLKPFTYPPYEMEMGKLKSDGTPMSLAEQISDDPIFLDFRPYKEVDFNAFLKVQ